MVWFLSVRSLQLSICTCSAMTSISNFLAHDLVSFRVLFQLMKWLCLDSGSVTTMNLQGHHLLSMSIGSVGRIARIVSRLAQFRGFPPSLIVFARPPRRTLYGRSISERESSASLFSHNVNICLSSVLISNGSGVETEKPKSPWEDPPAAIFLASNPFTQHSFALPFPLSLPSKRRFISSSIGKLNFPLQRPHPLARPPSSTPR
jgi:hypothetical protein